MERDFTAAEQSRRLAQLNAVERGLVFGRTDAHEPENHATIPKTMNRSRCTSAGSGCGTTSTSRASSTGARGRPPVLRRYPRDPVGLIRRRHIYTRDRTVTGVDNEVFDLDRLSEPDRQSLSGEAMLIASITVGRTGRMRERGRHHPGRAGPGDPRRAAGVLVVSAAVHGTSVAALHRAAYLLYTHRRTLKRRGVLVIGPNATFLRYISQVLPSLGETDVVLTSMAELFPASPPRPTTTRPRPRSRATRRW